MSVYELNRDQLDELKQAYVSEMVDCPSWWDLATAAAVPDDVIFQHFGGICFVPDDFGCTAGGVTA